jgi:hydroxymethylbilane synthase
MTQPTATTQDGNSKTTVRLGTRASQLARWQADWVAKELTHFGASVEIVEITTCGDVHQKDPIAQMGGQGLFTKEIQAALLRGDIDVAVHSLKDLPTETVRGLVLAAVPAREPADDALVSVRFNSLDELPHDARVGTGSRRRLAQLLHLRPDLHIEDIRGNLDTRLAKLDAGHYDAIVLACAGLHRLGLATRIRQRLGPPRMFAAAGQGALGIECRAGDEAVRQLLASLEDGPSRQAVTAERILLATLEAGCLAPVGVWGRVVESQVLLDGVVVSLDGRQYLRASYVGTDPVAVGQQVADELLGQGAGIIIADSK